MRYINSEDIVNDIKNSMASYFNSGKVDESILPRIIRKCLGKMGTRPMPVKQEVVVLKNGKAELPKGLYKIISVAACDSPTILVKNELKSRPIIESVHYGNGCGICVDECGNALKITYQDYYDKVRYDRYYHLKMAKTSTQYCTDFCPNRRSRCGHEFEVKEEFGRLYIVATIDSGPVYVQYYSSLEGEDSFEVPNNQWIIDWIYEEMRYEIYKYLYDNGEDVLQRMQHAKQELAIKEAGAIQVYRRGELKDYYDAANLLAKRFVQHQAWLERYNYTTESLCSESI